MEKNVDKIIKNVEESALDKPTATLVISSKSDKLFFIGDALCQYRCRILLKKIFTFRPGSAPLPG